VDDNLQIGGIGRFDHALHGAGRCDPLAGGVFVEERMEHLGGAGPERAIHVTLDTAEASQAGTATFLGAEVAEVLSLGDRPEEADTAGECALLLHGLVEPPEFVPRGAAAAVDVVDGRDAH
jgi:hypothetical protein